ncbi:MAG: DUF3098 domain-containing protein [Bacteroidota bacterium]
MSKKTNKKKVVVTKKSNPGTKKKNIAPTISRSKSTASSTVKVSGGDELIFNRQNYLLMVGGAVLVALGLLLMSGGAMPDPDTWDPDIIYGTRRTVIAPFLILLGLVVEIFAIFKR